VAELGGQIFRRPVRQPFETWQVGAVRLPMWLRSGGDPFRPWIALCLNLDSGKVVAAEPGAEEEVPSLLERALAEGGREWRTRPARVQVAEVAWAQALDDLLSPQGVAVETRPEVPELSQILARLSHRAAPDDPRPGPLTGEGVTLEGLAAFARAAADFLAAAGWRHLNHEDVVRIEAPDVEAALRGFVVVHQGGRSAPELRFLPDLAAVPWVEDVSPDRELDDEDGDQDDDEEDEGQGEAGEWTVELLKPWEAPVEDGDLWERHGLPWAGDGFIPVAGFWQGEDFRRPDHRQLALFEGLLAALAATAEEDLDSGRWEKGVATAGGPLEIVLSLPELLEPAEELPAGPSEIWRLLERSMRDMRKRLAGGVDPDLEEGDLLFLPDAGTSGEPETPEDTPERQAEALLDRAYAARGRRAVLLAREALEAWPDCADAYNLLARRAPDSESAARLYELGVAAGERALGPAAFAEAAGHFWGVLETRPYMRARQGLADSLVEMKRLAEAAEHFAAMLVLNPNDNQGIRHTLVNVLIGLDRDAEAWELVGRYPDDRWALLEYPRALLWFRREGDSVAARRALKRAVQSNRFVPGMLLQSRDLPPPSPYYSPGREEEAVLYRVLSWETWTETADALGWLRQRTAPPRKPAGKGKGKKRKKKGR
jgi:tetratricopeptide (TPR) repeat protein